MSTTITTRSFSLSFGDYCRFYVASYYRAYLNPLRGVLLAVVCLALPALMAWRSLSQGYIQPLLTYLVGSWVLWLGILPLVGLISWTSTVGKNATLKGPRVAELSPAGFAVIGDSFETRQQWGQFTSVGQAGRIIYLMTNARTGMIVRKDAFTSDHDWQSFVAEAKRHIAAAKDKHAQVFYDEPIVAAPAEGLQTPPFHLTFGIFYPYYLRILYGTFVRPGTLIVVLLGFAVVPLWLQRQALLAGDWSGLPSLLAPLLTFLALFPPLMALLAWPATRKTPAAKGPRTVTLTPERIVAKGDAYDVSIAWGDMSKITHDFGQLIAWTGTQGGVLVPDSAFADTAAARAFHAEAVRLFKAAKSAAAKSTLDG